jgi:hypothetical protein
MRQNSTYSSTVRAVMSHPNKDFLPSKLTTPYKGPYVVLSQYKNDVTCKHANVDTIQVFHIDRVKPFYGSLEEATVQAQVDYQQFAALNITAYRGDPEKRSEMEFLLEYEDGTISWKSWDKDLLREVCPFNTATPTTSSHGSPVAAITNRAPILIVRPALIGYNGFPSTGMLRLDCPTKTLVFSLCR